MTGESDSGRSDPATHGWAFQDWVARQAWISPETTAMIDAATGETWTYAALDERVDRTAGRLAALGIGPGDHLGTLAGTRTATVALVHAAVRVGAVLVPLNARLPAEAVAAQVDRADLAAAVCETPTGDLAREAVAGPQTAVPIASLDDPGGSEASTRDRSDVVGLGSVDPDETFERATWSLTDRQAILFTSGTTGDPKAVTLTAGNLLASAVASAFRLGITPSDRWLCELPAYHMGGIAPFYRSALYGTTIVVQERDESGFDPDRTIRNCQRYDVTGISLVPTQLDRMLDATEGRISRSLRFVLLGGGPAPESLIERCGDRGVPACPTYGMTETASQIATARPDEAVANPGTVGRTLAVTDLTVVDDDGTPLGPGESGELVVAGPTVTPGYYGDPEATDAAFGEYGLYTGDSGFVDDAGRAYVHGRRADRIRTGGETVDPAVVRDAIRDLQGVDAVAVVGIEDDEWGERVAALVVRSDPTLEATAIRDGVRDRLADYERPRSVAFAEKLPRTASGTVDRDAARTLIRESIDGNE